jgi:cysteine desulfurase
MVEGIYLDNSATTPIREEALQAMVTACKGVFGNSSSVHTYGQAARKALEDAREQFALCIGADPEEIVFTSGGTESDNLAIRGAAMAARARGNHIVTCATEHHAVLHCCQALEREGFSVTYLPVDSEGNVDLDGFREAIRGDTILVSIMMANNETGALLPIGEMSRIARGRDIIVHSDAVQVAGAHRPVQRALLARSYQYRRGDRLRDRYPPGYRAQNKGRRIHWRTGWKKV